MIRRAGSQRGVPHSWVGGSLTGPNLGVNGGADTVGFNLGFGQMLAAQQSRVPIKIHRCEPVMRPHVTRIRKLTMIHRLNRDAEAS